MELSSNVFHAQAYRIINQLVSGAKDHGLEVSTMPPQLSIIIHDELDIGEDFGSTVISSTLPDILQDVDPSTWSWFARCRMEDEDKSIGFIFWCVVESDDQDQVFGASYLKGDGWSGFLSDFKFESEPLQVDPMQVVPPLCDNYEEEYLVH
jgi:hypothetical protein